MKVLVVENSPITRKLMERSLSGWGYEPMCCLDETEAMSVVASQDCPRLALIDWTLPEINGLEICRMLRTRDGEGYIYTVLLSSKNKPEDIVQGIEAGADDYITKPFNPHELKVRLRTGERIIQLQNDLLRAKEQLQQAAITDPLTGLLNRRAFYSKMQQELIRGKRSRSPLGLIMLDIDHFKQVNDTYGHITGDHVLREAARRIQFSIREYDSAGRFGGEEFLVQAPDCNPQCIQTIAERIRINFQNTPFNTLHHAIPISISAGYLAVGNSAFELSIDQLIHAVDQALYKAKQNGRNRIEYAQPDTAHGSQPHSSG